MAQSNGWRHFRQKPVPFFNGSPAPGYETAFLAFHYIWVEAGVLLFRQLDHLSGTASANEFLAVGGGSCGKFNFRHGYIPHSAIMQN